MRIGLISASFLPNVGGMEWKVHYLATEYALRGLEVTVFAGRPRVSLAPIHMPLEPTYEVVRCSFPIRGVDRLGLTEIFFRRAILRHHRARPYDVLHSHHLGMPTGFAVAVKDVVHVPVVATTCGGDVQTLPAIGYGDRLKPHLDRLVRANLRRVDVVGAVSEAMEQELERLGTTARIVRIPNGVPWETFQKPGREPARQSLGLPEQALVVLSIGRNQAVKGYEYGLRAFALLTQRFPSALYVIVGRNVARLADLASSLGIGDRVRLIEEMPMDQLPAVFHAADVFFNPSLMEGFSQVNAQALAVGIASVVTDAPGNRDAGDGGGALVVRSGDPDAMADALSGLLSDRTRRQRVAEAARATGRRYSWSRIAADYVNVFNTLGKSTRSGRELA